MDKKQGRLNFSKEDLEQTVGSFLQVITAFAMYIFTVQEACGISVV